MASAAFKQKVLSKYTVASATHYYHGAREEIPLGHLEKTSLKWTAYDKQQIDMPFWVTPSLKFAKLHGSHIYEVQVDIPSSKIFGDRPYTKEGRYWKDMAVNEGKLLYDALDEGELFAEVEDFERVFAAIIAEDFDVIETKEFIDWAKKNKFEAAYVQGDGERNLMVFNPSNIKIVRRIET